MCVGVQKIDGCNKMRCSKCNVYFCWLCLMVIPNANPYVHFNTTTSPCFNKLFQGVALDMPDMEFVEDFDVWQLALAV